MIFIKCKHDKNGLEQICRNKEEAKIRKQIIHRCILSPMLFKLYIEEGMKLRTEI